MFSSKENLLRILHISGMYKQIITINKTLILGATIKAEAVVTLNIL